MEKYEGHGITERIAIGTICVVGQKKGKIVPRIVEDVAGEIARYEEAAKAVADELRELSADASRRIGEWDAKIFEVHAMMVEDVDYREEVMNTIRRQKVCAEYSVSLAGAHFTKLFNDMEDEYFRARALDVSDISERLIRKLCGEGSQEEVTLRSPHILVAKDLTPGELMQQERSRILGIVTECGTAYSHTSILAKSMNIPLITGIKAESFFDGQQAILDGSRGLLIVNPDANTVKEYLRIIGERAEWEQNAEVSRIPAVTKSGKRIPLLANIGDETDLENAIRCGAEGIGLLRSEFLFMNAAGLPSEEEQYRFYQKVVEKMGDCRVVIRTVDIGADKPAPCLSMPAEENPALGCRGIRVSLANEELFRNQLRAIFRAGQNGNVSVLYPMISTESEMKQIAGIVSSVREELLSEGIDTSRVKQGIMIETPAAALLCDRLAEYADFFSIGTNDLAQYVLAVDRKNAVVEKYYDQRNEAVLRLIGMIVGNAHRKGIPVGLCGELAADPEATDLLVGLGIDELSVSPSLLPKVRNAILNSSR